MLNAAQFAAAKQAGENELLKKIAIMHDDEGKLRPFAKYEPLAREITTKSRDIWLRVEYDSNKANAVSGEQFRGMMRDKALYPYWWYKGVMDSKERPEHRAMEGLVFRVGDPAGDACFPVNDWNCRCVGISIDGMEIDEKGLLVLTHEQMKGYLENNVDEQFRYNPAIQGTMPKEGHSYFEAMGSANEGNYKTFGLQPTTHMGFDRNLEGLAAIGLHYMVEVVEQNWRRDHHIGPHGTIVFQNQDLLTNVEWNSNSLHHVHKHQRGFENIPATITSPDEVWASWADEATQLVAKRTYLKFGKVCYLVFTEDGVIKDAYALSPNAADKHRTGIIL